MSQKMFNALQSLVASGFKGRIAFVQDGRLIDVETSLGVSPGQEFDLIAVDETVSQNELCQIMETQLPLSYGHTVVKMDGLKDITRTRAHEPDYSKNFRRHFGSLNFGELLEAAEGNHERRLKWAEEARLGRERDAAAQAKRERRRQRNIRLQK